MTQQAVINQEKFVRIGGEIIDVENEITVNYLGKPAKQVMIRNITEPKRAKEAMLRATVAELVKQELEKKLLSASR